MQPNTSPYQEDVIEDVIDLAKTLPVLQRAVLAMIASGYTQVEIAVLLKVRKNTVSQIKIRARNKIMEGLNPNE